MSECDTLIGVMMLRQLVSSRSDRVRIVPDGQAPPCRSTHPGRVDGRPRSSFGITPLPSILKNEPSSVPPDSTPRHMASCSRPGFLTSLAGRLPRSMMGKYRVEEMGSTASGSSRGDWMVWVWERMSRQLKMVVLGERSGRVRRA
jgi:hypothetical protein